MENIHCRISLNARSPFLWQYQVKGSGRVHRLAAPRFEIDGAVVEAALDTVEPAGPPVPLANGCVEYSWQGALAGHPGLSLLIRFRLAVSNPVVRFAYTLKSDKPRKLTKAGGVDRLEYAGISLGDYPQATEVRLSDFLETVHSYCPQEAPVAGREFAQRRSVMGPILTAGDGSHQLLLAYEHGSMVPDAFIRFDLDEGRGAKVRAVKGNYVGGQELGPKQPFETIWLDFAAVDGDLDLMARHFRTFVLKHLSANAESRKPYIFYNTWNYQERNQAWNQKPYLESMNLERMLAEIDVAHRMGIEVFVLDTGWYEKSGDWRVSMQRFPDGLKKVKAKLNGYGMKLGLWFAPTTAALTSSIMAGHQECVMSWQGKKPEPHQVWETDFSLPLCLASRFWMAVADELIRVSRELGVTYFKWDAVGQYGCDDPGHGHGGPGNSAAERADAYAFQLPLALARIADRICAAIPEAIVDFDVTESHRAVGLGFLAAGKYFLINNGPYFGSYNIPCPPGYCSNMFFFPGPARAWICRAPLGFDKWIPSTLFLTHYLPDDPADNQLITIASLILGQNGIWGDLPTISQEGVERFGAILGRYKQVRDDITNASPVRSGPVGGDPEVHEKIDAITRRGAVVLFASHAGTYSYLTENTVAATCWCTEGVTVERDPQGRATITATFDKPNARIVFFGVEPG
jgi:alpha-galactosidase